MYRIRSKFYKKDDMVFISHLDLIRLFERAFRRAHIPVSYSQGFNPHPIMSFATALGIGISSDAEYMDIKLTRDMDVGEFMAGLNNQLPDGLEIIASRYIPNDLTSLMATIKYSSYIVKFDTLEQIDENELKEKLSLFMQKEELLIIRKKKRKRKHNYKRFQKEAGRQINIRTFIQDINIIKTENTNVVCGMVLATGSSGNLKPEIVVSKLGEEMHLPIVLEGVRVHRTELYKEIRPELLTPLDGI